MKTAILCLALASPAVAGPRCLPHDAMVAAGTAFSLMPQPKPGVLN